MQQKWDPWCPPTTCKQLFLYWLHSSFFLIDSLKSHLLLVKQFTHVIQKARGSPGWRLLKKLTSCPQKLNCQLQEHFETHGTEKEALSGFSQDKGSGYHLLSAGSNWVPALLSPINNHLSRPEVTFCRESSLFGTDLEKLPINWLRPHTHQGHHPHTTHTHHHGLVQKLLCPPKILRSGICRLPYSAFWNHPSRPSCLEISSPKLICCPRGGAQAPNLPLMMPIPCWSRSLNTHPVIDGCVWKTIQNRRHIHKYTFPSMKTTLLSHKGSKFWSFVYEWLFCKLHVGTMMIHTLEHVEIPHIVGGKFSSLTLSKIMAESFHGVE